MQLLQTLGSPQFLEQPMAPGREEVPWPMMAVAGRPRRRPYPGLLPGVRAREDLGPV